MESCVSDPPTADGRYNPNMVKFVHTADWQLGMTRHFLHGEAQARFDAARIEAVGSIGELAATEGCAFVVVCGDVFESNQVDRKVLLRALEKMRANPEVDFYLLPGNHDPLDASSIFGSRTFADNKPDNVKVLRESEPLQAAPGVELVPAPWTSKRPLTDLVNDACKELGPTDAVRIVVAHGAVAAYGAVAGPRRVDALSPDEHNPALVSLAKLRERIGEGLIHYAALGDRHSTTDVGDTGRVWYSGAPEPTDYNETDPGNVLVVDLDAEKVNVETRPVGAWRFERRDWELSGDADIDALEQWLSDLGDKSRTIVKLALIGQVSVAQKARLDNLLDHHSDLLAALETWDRRSELAVIPDGADLDDFGLSGYAHEALGELREKAESGEQAVAARDALALLHRLAGAAE